MLAIYFDNGDFLFGRFQGLSISAGGIYTIDSCSSLQQYKKEISNIRLGKEGWWYPINRIAKFKDIDEGEAIQFNRDNKLEDVLG